ncbi:MFS transporter [Carnobacterium sp.]|uniref:MFS transporter n=1 Tax=Carnobacterium sp. TaxID=48221 RepID=UPI0028ABC04A|nr:MFS transporter [Carnobacterium sp.]
MTKHTSLTLKYAGLQSLYWMCFCAIYGFASVFLLAKNFENQQIGVILALVNIFSVVLQPAVGFLVDQLSSLSLKKVISSIAIVNILFLIGLITVPDNPLISTALYIGVTSLTLTLQPLLNSLIFEHINEGLEINYGLTRGVGSLSFAFISFFLGRALNEYNATIIPLLCVSLYLIFLLLIVTFPATETQLSRETSEFYSNEATRPKSLLHFFKQYERFLLFLIAIVFLFGFHTIINSYLVQIMASLGGKDSDFGLSLTIAASVELPAMLGFGYLASKYKSSSLLKISSFFFVVRSLLFLGSSTVWMINIAQLFQALSFAIYVPASAYYVNKLMKKGDKVKGQTLVIGATTLGSVFGNGLGGWLLDNATVHTMLTAGMLSAVFGCLLLFYAIKKEI